MECPHCNEFVPDSNYRCPNCKKVVRDGVEPSDFGSGKPGKSSLTLLNIFIFIIVIALAGGGFYFYKKQKDKPPAVEQPAPTTTQSTPEPTRDSPPLVHSVAKPEEKEPDASDKASEGDPDDQDNTDDSADDQQTEPTDDNAQDQQDEKSDDPYAWVNDKKSSDSASGISPGEEVDLDKLTQYGQITIFDFYSKYCKPCAQIAPYLEKLDAKRDDITVIKIDINRPDTRGIDWKSPVAKQYQLSSIPFFMIYDKSGTLIFKGKDAYQKITEYFKESGII